MLRQCLRVAVLVTIASSCALVRAGPPTQLLLTNTEFGGDQTGVKTLDLNTGAILGFLIPEDWPNNGNLWPVEAMSAGPNRTILMAQSGQDTVRQYDEFGNFVGLFIDGAAVNNIRAIIRSPDGNHLFTSDWSHDNVHRFEFLTGAPAPIAADPLGEFIPGGQPPPDLDLPQALTILGTGELLVVDVAQKKLLKHDPTTGILIGSFVVNPGEDITGGTVRDIDVLPNGDVVVAVSGSGDDVRTYTAAGVLDPTRTFSFNNPAGVHVLPNGEYLVTSGSTFGQGQGLFRVDPTSGTILETLDNLRAYGALELITLVDTVTLCPGPGNGDVDLNGVVDGRDIAPFSALLISGSGGPPDPAFCAADLSGDGVLTFADVDLLVQTLVGP